VITVLGFFSVGRPGMVCQLDPLLAKIIRQKTERLVIERGQIAKPSEYGQPSECDFFRLVYHYTLEHAPAHLGKMQNYVVLFGFNRALSFLSVLLFWFSLPALIFSGARQQLWLLIILALLSNIFFFGFAKFYRRLSLES